MRGIGSIVIIVALISLSAAGARAQVCGDANGDGRVTVSDGVQVLRAAAGLSSVCVSSVCDVDGTGATTVTDGVLVLRKAADLSVDERCDLAAPQVKNALAMVQPFVTVLFGLAPKLTEDGNASGDCPAGGTLERTIAGQTTTLTLRACRFSEPDFGTFQFDGTITASGQSVTSDLTGMDVASGETVRYQGTISGDVTSGGDFVANGGPILATGDQGGLTLHFDDFTASADGDVLSGSARLEDPEGDFALATIVVTVRSGGGSADVLATFDDGSSARYILEFDTGNLTPVHGARSLSQIW